MAEVLPDEKFIERLKVLVEKAGSAEKLAKMTGVGSRNIGKYLAGSDPSRRRLIRLAQGMSVKLAWLAMGEGQMYGEIPEGEDKGRIAQVSGSSAKMDHALIQQTGRPLRPGIDRKIIHPYRYLGDPPEDMPPTLDEITNLLRMIVICYRLVRPECNDEMERAIPLTFRYFVDNFDRANDEVEITEYIKEWF